MKIELVKQRKREIIEQFGPWTGHKIHLGNNIYTNGEWGVGNEEWGE